MNSGGLDFGYTWPWTHGHLVLALVLAAAAAGLRWGLGAARSAWVPRIAALWALAAFLVVAFVFRMNDPLDLPTPAFLSSGTGRVLDMGSGSGRAALAVLTAHPGTTVVALDDWSAEYIAGNSPGKLLANAAIAGVADRIEVRSADMRSLPFADEQFDAIVSTYAIDHLGSRGRTEALSEAARVLRPGGEFLLMVLNQDRWVQFVYGPLAGMHGFRGGANPWLGRLSEAGFEVVESGLRPATAYFLARKPEAAGPWPDPRSDDRTDPPTAGR